MRTRFPSPRVCPRRSSALYVPLSPDEDKMNFEGECCKPTVVDARLLDATKFLEAAHIRNFSRRGRYDVRNGILLRADWHTLFDLGMWAIHPNTHHIIVASALSDTSYTRFAGRRISLPQDPKCAPNDVELHSRYRSFKKGQAKRGS
jgi:predicted restriction endonuclease